MKKYFTKNKIKYEFRISEKVITSSEPVVTNFKHEFTIVCNNNKSNQMNLTIGVAEKAISLVLNY